MTASRAARHAALALLLWQGVAAAQELPRVKLFATGGTISNHRDGRLTGEELVRRLPDLSNHAAVETEQFANTSSSSLTLDEWLGLSRRIGRTFAQDRRLSGVVVTSGTDTLEELAYFLHLTVRDERPVVVVGSMRNPSVVGYEGAANLLAAVRVAADPRARGKGTLVVLNDEINSAREVTKTDALRLETFQSRPAGVLGVVDADRVVFYRDTTRRHTASSEFDVEAIDRLPRVDVLLVYQEAPGDLIAAALDHGAKGLVIATAGAGAMSRSQWAGVRHAMEKKVPVVITTRAGSGRIAPDGPWAGGRRDSTLIAGEDLQPVKARVLLMLALARTNDPGEIQRMFLEY